MVLGMPSASCQTDIAALAQTRHAAAAVVLQSWLPECGVQRPEPGPHVGLSVHGAVHHCCVRVSMQEGSLNRPGSVVGPVESTTSPTTSCVLLLLLLLLLLQPSWGWVRAWNMMDMASYALQVCGVCRPHQEGVRVRALWVQQCRMTAPFPCDMMPTLKHPETHACHSGCCGVVCFGGVQVAIVVLHLQRTWLDEGWFSILVATQQVLLWMKLVRCGAPDCWACTHSTRKRRQRLGVGSGVGFSFRVCQCSRCKTRANSAASHHSSFC